MQKQTYPAVPFTFIYSHPTPKRHEHGSAVCLPFILEIYNIIIPNFAIDMHSHLILHQFHYYRIFWLL